MRPLVYAAPFALFAPAALAMLWGGAWSWFLPVFTFGLLPVLDQLHRGSTHNLDGDDEAAALADRRYDVLLWAVVPAQYALLGLYLWRLSVGGFAAWETAGIVATMGIACGVYGINVAHELGHRRTKHEQAFSKALLLTSLYLHFFVEHNRGHHRRVATPEDPASSRLGESVYAFWPRTIVGSWRSAWDLEASRVTREGHRALSWHNAIVRYAVVQIVAVAAVGIVAGPVAMGGFVVAALGGILLLETVNYLEHHGLARAHNQRGTYERVQPHHSWNSNRPMGRIFLFDLTRHADHHANATRKYQVLRHMDDAPELPAGYPAMILAALVPPLFHALMAEPLARWRVDHDAQAVAAK